jgi:Putative prokaryotic signal transducing protein
VTDEAKTNQWVEVLAAPNQMEAEIAIELLTREGIPARMRPGDSLAFLGGLVSPLSTRVLVPKEYEEQARSWLEATPAEDLPEEEPEPES